MAHVKMMGACIDCPISLLTMKLGIQRLLKENFTEIKGVNAITDVDISALYGRG
jgi:Fe-S cluster biogenesis protein NfuA